MTLTQTVPTSCASPPISSAATVTPECTASSANYSSDWNGPYIGFDHVELMLEGHNTFLPLPLPRGHHYERWYHADGCGEERTALYMIRSRPDDALRAILPQVGMA